MLLTISGHVRNIHIVSGGIIQRLCDFEDSKDIVNKVIKKLGKVCEKLHVEFWPVVKPLFHKNSTGSLLQAKQASLVT